jgi:ankyrin repeat protein
MAMNETLGSFRLLEALRNGDQTAIKAHLSASQHANDALKELTSPLHLAVRCAEFETIKFILSCPEVDLNAVETQNGNSALHLASSFGRIDVVELFLVQKHIDDTIRNKEGRSAMDVADTIDIVKLFQISRAELNMAFQDAFERWEKDAPGSAEELNSLLSLPRVGVIDLNARSRATGTTLLHEAVRRRDAKMIEEVVRKGADIFGRNKRGKSPLEATKDEKIKALLQQLSNADQAMALSGNQPGLPPTFRGYLGKWTNYARGYKTRWFVLENGILSYYHTQEEEGKQSRGSLNLRFAKIRADPSDRHRFEVLVDGASHTARTSSANRLYLRAGHPAERARWAHVLQQSVEFFEMDRVSSRAESVRSFSMSKDGPQSPQSANIPAGTSFQIPSRATTPFRNIPSPGPGLSRIPTSFGAAGAGSASRHSNSNAHAEKVADANKTPSIMTRGSRTPSEEILDQEAAPQDGFVSQGMPFENAIPIVASSIRTQLELAQQLLHGDEALSAESIKALSESLQSSLTLFDNYQTMMNERKVYMLRRYEQEIQAKRLWEENIRTLAQQYAEMEEQLQEAAQENARKRKALREARDGYSNAGYDASPVGTPALQAKSGAGAIVKPIRPSAQRGAINLSTASPSSPALTPSASFADMTDLDDPDDEFFDAIESGNLPNLKVEADEEKSVVANREDEKVAQNSSAKQDLWPGVEPYRRLRDRMPIGKDNRPSLSLWSVLKNNIGKDLTKISFPVSFNEPTSMLQRMAEDMTYAYLLDVAVRQKESSLRVAYVAAFACSNYVTTLGRVAKPFNPLLGETFEFVDLNEKCKYRYQSEQVSHHPPISACIAESLEDDGIHTRPAWEYSGCVQAQSKFLGRTFEIRPTGIAHVKLRVNGSIEHYTFKKVTSSVSGFVTGSPTIDHFGEMIVKCHTTGDECVMTFKPRGWRSSGMHELKGTVTSKGATAWEIAGRWSSQMVARRANVDGNTTIDPDGNIDSLSSDPTAQGSDSNPEMVLLWKYSPQPPGPFNLTPYATMLNDLPEGLHDYLPPTDCRMRPDLRLFERGQYDEADVMKRNLEEFQRATRRKRETGEIAPHKPKYFVKTIESSTQADYWEPIRQDAAAAKVEGGEKTPSYWVKRQQGNWDDVERIFGEYTA